MEERKTKRGPGRPRKTPARAAPPRRGILKVPDNPVNLIELEYDKPQTFKKFASYWKSLNAEKVGLTFTPDRLMIYTRDYKENSYVRHRVHGSSMVSYYCPTVVSVVLLSKDVDLILQKLDKECGLIDIIQTIKGRDRILNFVLHNEWGIPEYFEVEVVVDPPFIKQFETCFDETVPYPLHFTLPGKYFKKAISDVRAFEDKWTIERYKIDGQSLTFTYKSANGHVKGRDIPPKKMTIQDDIPDGDHFSVSIYANVLKPTSQAMLAENISIKATDEGGFIWLVADVDGGAIPTDILVKVVDLRKPGAVAIATE